MIGGAVVLLALAMGTTAYALDNGGVFEQMLPQMKQAHPNYSDEQLKQMYDSCHTNTNDASQMMNGDTRNMADMMKQTDMTNMMGRGKMADMMDALDK